MTKLLLTTKHHFAGIFLAMLILDTGTSAAQQSYTFTNAGATGSIGPTQTQINTSYTNTNLSGSVTVNSSGIQSFTVPISGGYRIQAWGAQGGGAAGGKGAMMSGDFTLTAGQVLNIIVGQKGESFSSDRNIGGGGGSYVISGTNNILLIAGGGGAARGTYTIANAVVTTSGQDGQIGVSTLEGAGGTSGAGGGGASCRGGGGAGWNSNGSIGGCGAPAGEGGVRFGLGGYGGGTTSGAVGGFGGGGSSDGTNNAWTYAGGGGGYSGGGGASTGDATPRGGGAGSINNGVNQLNAAGTQTGHGKVIITELCPLKIYASTTNSDSPVICSGQSVTLTTTGTSNFNWSTGNLTSNSIVVSPVNNTTYSVSATTSLNCTTNAYITVTVSSGSPVLSVNASTNNICMGETVTLTATGALTYTWSNNVTNGVGFSPTSTTSYTVSGENGCGITTSVTIVTVSPLPVAAISSTSTVCAGKPATLTAAGANSFTWTIGTQTVNNYTVVVGPSVNTTYTVIGNSGVCTGTAAVSLQVNPNPTLFITASSPTVCVNGSVAINVAGADSYSWTTPGLSGNAVIVTPSVNSSYVVIGTNTLGCSSSINQVIITKPRPNLTVITSPVVVCSGSSSTITVNGADYYNWSVGASGNSIVVNPINTSTYMISGAFNDTGCSTIKTATVFVFQPTVSITSSTAICLGQQIVLSAGPANSYSWSNNVNSANIAVSPTITTVYTLTASVTGSNIVCPAYASVNVTVNPLPVVTASASRSEICRRETVTITAGGASSYLWNNGNTNSAITVTQNIVTNANYNVTGTDANGCSNTASVQVKVNSCNGISDVSGLRVAIYPNPSAGDLVVELPASTDLLIVNELGQVVRFIAKYAGSRVRITGLDPGVYFVTGIHENEVFREKLIIHQH